MSGHIVSVEGRRIDADTHLALLGVKIVGAGILGAKQDTEEKIIKYGRK